MLMPLGHTPLLSFTVNELGLDGGIMVTASHNPAEHNGFKLLLGNEPLHGEALGALWEIEPAESPGGGVQEVNLNDEYLAALSTEVAGLDAVSVAWDSGNGATGREHRSPMERWWHCKKWVLRRKTCSCARSVAARKSSRRFTPDRSPAVSVRRRRASGWSATAFVQCLV
jgi:hypothetical protein